ncbi:hypothetical protein [Bacillus toyonensis]|uniref:hypothetical protein n=1 Tax=Bacillus toyonensis TaxID=155322 RepID=UPI0015D486D6|nr:hypothetical protein [Bacillus toyonensis]
MFSKRMILFSILSMLSLAVIIDYNRVGGRSLIHGCLLAIIGLVFVVVFTNKAKKDQ